MSPLKSVIGCETSNRNFRTNDRMASAPSLSPSAVEPLMSRNNKTFRCFTGR